ncbi:MAG: hypothetical protein K8R92_08435 [Planctomycetes bacterium]|nr:hypothetical protein [Planctomycetota bacterium]
MTTPTTSNPPKKRRKLILWTAASLVVVVVLLVALLPTIASMPMFRGFITDAVASKVNGKVSIGDMSFSWSGPQRIDNFSIVGDDGKSTVLVSLSLQNGFLELLSTTIKQIDMTVSGKVAGELGADGKLSLLSLAKSAAPTAPAAPPHLPAAAAPGAIAANWPGKIQVVINGFDVDIANANGPRFAIEGLKGKVALSNNGPIEIQLAANTKIGDKPGSISANGTFKDVMTAAGAFDPIGITGSLNAEVNGVLVPVTGASLEIAQAKFVIAADAGKPIDLSADINTSVNGQAAPIRAKMQAYRPGPGEPIASWAKDPRTWAGTISVQDLPTALLEKYVQGTPINIARDLGPTLTLAVATNSSTGFDLSLKSAQVKLQCTAAIDMNTGAVQGKTTTLDASLAPELLSKYNVVTPKALPIAIALQSFTIPPPLASGQFNLAQITAQGTMSTGAAQFTSAGNAPVAMGALFVTLAAAPLADKVDFVLQTTINGAPINTRASLTGLMKENAFTPKQMMVDSSTQLGPFDPSLLPGMPSNIVEILRQVQPGNSTIHSTLAGSYEKGSMDLKVQMVPGTVNAKANWDATTATISIENTAWTVSPGLAEWASQGKVVLSAPAKCTIAAGPIKVDRAALEKGQAGFLPSPISIFVDKLAIAKAPGLTGTATVQNAVVRGDFDADGPQTFKGTLTATALLANGLPGGITNATLSELSIQATVEKDPNAPGSTVAVTASSLGLTNVQGLSEPLLGKNLHANFTGPLSMNGAATATLSMDVLEATGPAAKIAGEFKTQPGSDWTASVTANEVSTQRIAHLLGMGDVPEWTAGGAPNAGKLKANVTNQSSAMTFAVNADLGRIVADLNGTRAADGSITLTKSSALASVPGSAVKNYLERDQKKTPIRNLSDLKVALDIASVKIPSVNGALDPLAAGAAIATKVRIEPFNLTFAPESLVPPSEPKPGAKPAAPAAAPAASQPEKLATLAFGATDVSLQTSGAESAQVTVNGSLATEGQPTKPMAVQLKAQNLAGADGKLNTKGMKLVADVNVSEFPSAIVDAITKGDGFIPNLAGPVFSVTLSGRTGFDKSDSFKGHVESPTLTLDIPAVRIVDGQMSVVPAEAITLQIRPDDNIRQKILRPINPILAEIELKNKAINTTVSEVRAPLPFDMKQTDARFVVQVGEVELEKKGQIVSLLNLATVKDGKSTIPGLVSPLNGEVNKGILTYKDFTIKAGKQGETWQQTIISDANINLTTQPAYANAINVRYPLEGVTNAVAANAGLNSVMGEINKALGSTTAEMRQAIQLKVVFSGPLQGDQLKMTVEPALDLKSGDDLLKGVGGMVEGILNGKSGTTAPGTTPAPGAKDPTIGDVLDLFKKKPK